MHILYNTTDADSEADIGRHMWTRVDYALALHIL